jgi:hypothetical protein
VATITREASAKGRNIIAVVENFITWKDEAKNCFRFCSAEKYLVVDFEKKILTFCRTLSNMLLHEFITL